MTADPLAVVSAERDHWKAHAEEAGRGFTQVCEKAAQLSARNVDLVAERDALRAKIAAVEDECDRAVSFDECGDAWVNVSAIRAALSEPQP